MSGHRIIFSGKKQEPFPLTGFDLLFNAYSNQTLIYDHILSEDSLIHSLEKALDYNPYFSGRIKQLNNNNPNVLACDSGVLFCVESFDCKIDDFTSYNGPHLDSSYTSPTSIICDEYSPLLQIKLSKYKNGSTLGLSLQHMLCDAHSFFHFLTVWAAFARGETPSPIQLNRNHFRKLAIGRDAQLDKRYIVPIASSNLQLKRSEQSTKRTFRLTSSLIKSLVEKAKSQGIKGKIGVRDSVWTAYLWKLIAGNQVSDCSTVTFTQAYNCRSLFGLNKDYFCNAGFYPHFDIKKETLPDLTINLLAEKILSIRDNLMNVRNNLLDTFAFMETRRQEGNAQDYWCKVFEHGVNGELVMNNMTREPIYDIDFGSGAPVWYEMPGREAGRRMLYALPTRENNGDILLLVTLPESEMTKFAKHLESPVTQ